MKNLLVIPLTLLAFTALVGAIYYHPYEEIGNQVQGDLVVKSVLDDTTGKSRVSLRKWSEATVPVVYSGVFSSYDKQVIRAAMQAIEDVSCVKFVPRASSHDNYVDIRTDGNGCWSSLGMHGGAQIINLDVRGCLERGTILHQLMHTLGFTHPSNRFDRDLYVRVELDNVNSFNWHNFDKDAAGDVDDMGMTYDYESIMHRGGLSFSKNGKHTVIAMHEDIELGQRDSLSYMDIKKLNKMYCEAPGM